MQKYSFYNDYSEGAHPNIIKALQDTNLQQETGYGYDSFSENARDSIKKLCGTDCSVYFISGGTQANLVALASMLKPYESVIAAQTGHIAVHEAGAIEATGHKINTITVADGKLTPTLIEPVVEEHTDEHMVKPRVVFISNSTEVGTTYSKSELQALSDFCKQNKLYLYLDGARIASALTSSDADLSLSDISNLTDMFYIGGTKAGALLGEAMVINNPEIDQEYIRHIKQRGGLLAKGRVLGIQFQELFKDNLIFELGKHANMMAELLTDGIKDQGYSFLTDSKTNQIFPVLPNTLIEQLEKLYGFYRWSTIDDERSSIRLVTSWATKQDMVEEFLKDLGTLG